MENLLEIKSDYNNWVLKNILMCGPYPGLDGINYISEKDANINLKNIIDDGIDTFICLQKEIDLSNNTIDQNFLWAFPKFKSYKISLNELYPENKFDFFHFPMHDQTIPECDFNDNLNKIIDLIINGKKIFIHCAGGHGRTGVYISCILMCIKKLKAKEALELTQKYHNQRRFLDRRQKRKVPSPSTKEQINFVYNFEKTLK